MLFAAILIATGVGCAHRFEQSAAASASDWLASNCECGDTVRADGSAAERRHAYLQR